jgi:hypothetical protein
MKLAAHPVRLEDEGVSPVPLRVRASHQRAWRWPLILSRYRRAGLGWRAAWQMTHWVIWYPGPR